MHISARTQPPSSLPAPQPRRDNTKEDEDGEFAPSRRDQNKRRSPTREGEDYTVPSEPADEALTFLIHLPAQQGEIYAQPSSQDQTPNPQRRQSQATQYEDIILQSLSRTNTSNSPHILPESPDEAAGWTQTEQDPQPAERKPTDSHSSQGSGSSSSKVPMYPRQVILRF